MSQVKPHFSCPFASGRAATAPGMRIDHRLNCSAQIQYLRSVCDEQECCEGVPGSIRGMEPIPASLSVWLEHSFTPQREFAYSIRQWREWVGHLAGVSEALDELPAAIDRRGAAVLINALLPTNVAGAFTVAMIWGHGLSNYGAYRTACILTAQKKPKGAPMSDAVAGRLSESVDIARVQGPVEGYRYLNNRPGKVAGLGPAFFTKWLFFITAWGDATSLHAAPVLDELVINWLRRQAHISLRPGRTDDYARYIGVLEEWGKPHGLTPAQVEERIFRAIRDDGAQ